MLSLSLAAGGGALIKVSGEGCGELLRSTRQWWADPRTLSLRGGTPGPSAKSTTVRYPPSGRAQN